MTTAEPATRSPGQPAPGRPVVLTVRSEAGRLEGSNERYEKSLADLEGLYRDAEAFRAAQAADDGGPVYWVESSRTEDGAGALITGLSVLLPGRVGAEYAMTRGHLHAIPDRAEVYSGLSGHGVLVLETLDGDSRVIEVRPGTVVYVPGHTVHRSVNVGAEPFVTQFSYPADAGQDYAIIERAGGMATLVLVDGETREDTREDGCRDGHQDRRGNGWTVRANPDHRGYRRSHPESTQADP